MLSFLREQSVGDLPAQKPAVAANQPDAETEDTQDQEYFTVAAQNKNVRKSTILLAILFGMGLLCLWFMIKKSTPQTTAAATAGTEETQIEIAITRLTGVRSEMFSRMDEIVNKFYEFADVLQVQVSELVKNPFELEMFLANLKEKENTEKSDFDAEMMRRQQLRQQTRDIQLLGIMQSDKGNCCMINDKVLYQGDLIKGFKVCQIGDRFVTLKCRDVEIVLKLSE